MAQEKDISWRQVTPAAEWTARDSTGYLLFKDQMWLLGGWTPKRVNDVWRSEDGAHWTQVTAAAPWSPRNLPCAVAFDDKMWLLGGGDLEACGDVWSSSDGKSWTCVSSAAPWPARSNATAVVFQDRIWLMGGQRNCRRDESNIHYADVWSSADGKNWVRVTDAAAWGRRSQHSSVVFNDRMWVVGGGLYSDFKTFYADVWSSADGVHWDQVVAEAPWVPRRFHESIVHDGAIWVVGGVYFGASRPYNRNDVWYSRDGKTWIEANRHAPWCERHEMALFSFKGRLWVVGGCGEEGERYDIVYNDIWSHP